MKEADKLKYLRSMVEGDDTDDVLRLYLKIAGQKVITAAYPYAGDSDTVSVPEKYHVTQVEIAAFLLNKRGAEGQTVHNENGISRRYGGADVPRALLSHIVPHCGVPE